MRKEIEQVSCWYCLRFRLTFVFLGLVWSRFRRMFQVLWWTYKLTKKKEWDKPSRSKNGTKKMRHFQPRSKALSPFSPSRWLPRPTETKDRESLGTRLSHCLGSFQMTLRKLYWCPKIWKSGHVLSQTKSVGVRLFSYVNTFYFSSTFVLLLSAHVTVNASVTP